MTATDSARKRAAGAGRRARSSRLAPHLVLVVVMLLWSANGVVQKVGMEHIQPLAFAAGRFGIAGLFMLGVSVLARRNLAQLPPARLLVACALLGIIGNQFCWATGLHLSTAVDLSLILGIGPILVALGWYLVARRPPSARQLGALGLGLAGVVAIVLQTGRGAGGNLLGDLIGLGAPVTWAAYTVLLVGVTRHTTATVFLAWIMLLGAAGLSVLAFFQELASPDRNWVAGLPELAYSALLSTGVAYALFFWALPRLGVTGTAIYSYLQPPIGATLGALFLGEPFGAVQGAGAIAIMFAAYLGNSKGPETSAARGGLGGPKPP